MMRLDHILYVWVLLRLVLLHTPAASTVFVSNSSTSSNTTSFVAALQDPAVTTIILSDDFYSVGASFDPYMPGSDRGPIKVDRNVTITAALGREALLDLQFARSAVEICTTCTVTFENITVANERRGSGSGVDLFLGRPGSRMVYSNANRFRAACASANDTAEVLSATKRSPYFPNPDGEQQMSIVNVTFRGTLYTDQLFAIDTTLEDPRRIQEGRGPVGGVSVGNWNSTRICRAIVDEKCLRERSSDACVNMLMDEVLAQDAAAASGSAARTNTAAVAAGAAVAGAVLVCALLATLLWVRRHKRRSKQQQQLLPQAADGAKPLSSFESKDAQDGDSDYSNAPQKARKRTDRHKNSTGPEGMGKGWEQSWTLTTPLVPREQRDAPIELQELLGSGSFGRVYKGVWAGRVVAVKIISHDTTSSDAVENEVALMVGFNHPNIVRAYHSITYVNSAQHSRKPSASSAGHVAAAAADTDSHTTSSASAPAGQESSSSHNVHSTSQGTAFALQTINASPDAAHKAAAAAAAGAAGTGKEDTSSSDRQQKTAAVVAAVAARQAAMNEPPWSTEDATTLTYDTTCSSVDAAALELQHADHRSSSRAYRAETWIVQEYCDMGTLDSVVSSWEGEEENDARMLARLLLLKDVASGLQVLHSNNVVHGDLNARNVLVSSSASAELGMVAKLADLGLSRAIKQHQTHRTTNTIGTMSHMPPELLRYGRMSPAGDIYAFGISMWELYTGTAAFKKLHYGQFFEYICLRNMRPLIPPNAPKDYAILMESCWATDPGVRPKAERIVECLRYMIIERQKNLAAAAEAAADDTAAAAAMAPNTPAIGGVQPAFLKMPSLLKRAADDPSPKPTADAAAAAGSPGAAGADAPGVTADGARRSGSFGVPDSCAAVAGSSPGRPGIVRLTGSSGSGGSRATPTVLSVDIFGGYSTRSNPTGLVRAFSAASKGSASEQGPGAAGRTEGDSVLESGENVEQPKLLLPQNSLPNGVHWFV